MRVWLCRSKDRDSSGWAFSPPILPHRTRKNGAPQVVCDVDLPLEGVGHPPLPRFEGTVSLTSVRWLPTFPDTPCAATYQSNNAFVWAYRMKCSASRSRAMARKARVRAPKNTIQKRAPVDLAPASPITLTVRFSTDPLRSNQSVLESRRLWYGVVLKLVPNKDGRSQDPSALNHTTTTSHQCARQFSHEYFGSPGPMAANCFLPGALQLTNVAEAGRAKESTTSVVSHFLAQERETMGHPLFVCDLQKCSSPTNGPRLLRGTREILR